MAPACPLGVGDQIKAVRAYREMLPVFRHDRCTNCHGGMDVLSDRHPGASGLDDALNPRDRLHDADFRREFSDQCTTCHDGLAGWTVPPPGQFFYDRNDEELCQQMKQSEETPELYVGHIRDDHGGIQFFVGLALTIPAAASIVGPVLAAIADGRENDRTQAEQALETFPRRNSH